MNILLCCGAGMSSGFLASSARKAAKKMGKDVTVEARSHTDVAGYLGKIDVLLLGSHYKTELKSFTDLAANYGTPVALIPADIYATLDGKRLIEFAEKTIAEAKQ